MAHFVPLTHAVMNTDAYPPITDYGLIGDGLTAALIDSQGSIDWLCPRRFDAPSIFARLLDRARGGYWSICPSAPFQSTHEYVAGTNVLRTRFSAVTGVATLTDFMPVHAGDSAPSAWSLIRVVEGIEGELSMVSACAPRPDYARAAPRITVQGTAAAFDGCIVDGPADWRHDAERDAAVCTMSVAAGERKVFVLRDATVQAEADPLRRLDETLRYWKTWGERCSYEGPYRDAVIRSALTLKMLFYAPTGAIVAAPTTSLPERIGGPLNWDYRYTWVRDASLTLDALLLAGYTDEVDAFFHWMRQTITMEKSGIKVLYPIERDGAVEEQELDHLDGYRGSRPVRIGNAASDQVQVDIYGEALDALHFAWKAGRYDPARVWEHVHPLVDWVAAHWQEPGHDLWEFRGAPRQYVYGKVMAWAALDRGVKIAVANGLPGAIERWTHERDRVRQQILEQGWSDKRGAFKQAYDYDRLDAANLRLSDVGFLRGDDPRMVATIERTLDDLMTGDLCYRYRDDSGHDSAHEGAFIICTFWLIDALILAGRTDQARDLFERILRQASPLGLYAEEMSPATHLQLGNFPQALSHIGVISAAVSLAHAGHTGRVKPEHARAVGQARTSRRHDAAP